MLLFVRRSTGVSRIGVANLPHHAVLLPKPVHEVLEVHKLVLKLLRQLLTDGCAPAERKSFASHESTHQRVGCTELFSRERSCSSELHGFVANGIHGHWQRARTSFPHKVRERILQLRVSPTKRRFPRVALLQLPFFRNTNATAAMLPFASANSTTFSLNAARTASSFRYSYQTQHQSERKTRNRSEAQHEHKEIRRDWKKKKNACYWIWMWIRPCVAHMPHVARRRRTVG
uniref:Uncharacterized protein n=1 Tax=Rhipicephalus zambeziensis TaxID=60191 RepID=A0A224YEJ9_9ACAR